jgi:hypothetical protein
MWSWPYTLDIGIQILRLNFICYIIDCIILFFCYLCNRLKPHAVVFHFFFVLTLYMRINLSNFKLGASKLKLMHHGYKTCVCVCVSVCVYKRNSKSILENRTKKILIVSEIDILSKVHNYTRNLKLTISRLQTSQLASVYIYTFILLFLHHQST